MRMTVKLNWFGLAGGALALIVVLISLFSPWWRLIVGENLITANLSPVNSSFSLFGTSFTIPLLFALNISGALLMTAAGIAMLIYSAMPTKPYAKNLLGFGFWKPLLVVVFFAVALFVVTVVAQNLAGLNIPLNGTATLSLPASLAQGFTLTAQVTTGFQWLFWLAVVTAGLCIAARIYHLKITPTQKSQLAPTISERSQAETHQN
jgi:hypothetical protein